MGRRFTKGRRPLKQSPKHNIAPALWNQWFRGAGVLCFFGASGAAVSSLHA